MLPHHRNADTFAGYLIEDWTPNLTELDNPAETAIRIREEWNDRDTENAWAEDFEEFLGNNYAHDIPALVIGMWTWDYEQDGDQVVEALVEHKDELPNLRALFFGDITPEECEISWIKQGDLSPLWEAFPNLEVVTIRGGDGLSIGTLDLPKLKSLRIETGGLDAEVVRAVASAKLPEVESVVLWLGDDNYGATTTIADLQGFYQCAGMPKLKYLGLCDSELEDEIAAFMATAPVLQRLETLDLSLGTLTDEGALALVTSPYVRSLKKLDLHRHYCTQAMIDKLQELTQFGVTVDTSEREVSERDWRFVAVGE